LNWRQEQIKSWNGFRTLSVLQVVKIHVDIRPERDETWSDYSLTPKGREYLVAKASGWQRLMRAMALVLDPKWDSGGEV
jgi:hypothetical protein